MADTTDDRQLDETIEESFPASDPPANTPEVGIDDGPLPRPAGAPSDGSSQPAD